MSQPEVQFYMSGAAPAQQHLKIQNLHQDVAHGQKHSLLHHLVVDDALVYHCTQEIFGRYKSPILVCWSIAPIGLVMLTKHFTDSCRKVISCVGDKAVVEPVDGHNAVLRRPLTILQISD
ncbi:hypothetical protein AAHE18_18G208800 [Arachis hypogaea]